MKRFTLNLLLAAAIMTTPSVAGANVPVFNFDDAAHRQLWTVKEGNLAGVFTPANGARAGSTASHYINTATGSGLTPNESLTGVIESPPFPVTENYYSILTGGGNHYDETYISVCTADTREEVWRSTGTNSDTLSTSVIDLSKAQGKTAIVRVVDRRQAGNGKILFGGIFRTDQLAAKDELVRFHIDLLKWNHSRADGEAWLFKNLESRHVPLLEHALVHVNNDPVQRACINHLRRFPSATSLPALLHAVTNFNETVARNASGAIRDNLSAYSPEDRQRIEQIMTGIVLTSPHPDLRIIVAGVLLYLNTPTAVASLQQAQKTAPPKVAHGIHFLLTSANFTKTEFQLPHPGTSAECWLRGMQYYVYLPKQWNRGKKWPLLVVVHGTWGHGHLYHDLVQAECDRLGTVAIAPTFDPHRFWGFGHFGGKWRPDLALIEAIQANATQLYLANKPCVLLGHSEGAQFVTRFTLVHPNGVKRVAISGTDELCWPDPNLIFPFGTAPNPEMTGGLPPLTAESWLKVPTLLIVGTADHKANISISEKWAAAVNKLAEEKGRNERVTFIRHEGGVHSLKNNYPMIKKWVEEGFAP